LLASPEAADSQKVGAMKAQGVAVSSEKLAQGVDTPGHFDASKTAGAKWFSGVWHLAWRQAESSTHSASQALMMRLLQLVANDADTRELEQVFKQDASLSYQLLRLVNSVAMGLPHKINSFGQAIVILGRRQLQRWLNLLVFTQAQQQGVVSLLQASAVMRARFLELASAALGASKSRQEEAFIVGMFSLLDVLFGMSMEQIIRPLNLNNDIVAALLERRGEMGTLLRVMEASEWGDAEMLASALLESGLSRKDFALAQFQASRWMQDVVQEMSRV
jgi:EAL and modified HD-GYP domain-containing signal transduction protein